MANDIFSLLGGMKKPTATESFAQGLLGYQRPSLGMGPMAQNMLGYQPSSIELNPLARTVQPSMMDRVSSSLGGIGSAFSGPGSNARLQALAASLLTGPSSTPISFGSQLAKGLLAGSQAAQAEQDRLLKRGLLEREMELAKRKLDIEEMKLTPLGDKVVDPIVQLYNKSDGSSYTAQEVEDKYGSRYLADPASGERIDMSLYTTDKPSKGKDQKISRENPVEYMVKQPDQTYKKEYIQSITIDGVEGLYRSVPKTEENPLGIEEVSLLDLGKIPEPTEGMTNVAVKLYDEANEAKRSVNNLSSFQSKVSEGFEGGLKGKITGWTGNIKSFFGVDLTKEEGLRRLLTAQQNSILGQNRLAIVGPGVMTEQDAARVIAALGGDITSWIANPQILIDAIQRVKEESKDIFISKFNSYNALREGKFPELERFTDIYSAPTQWLDQGLTQEDWLNSSEEDRRQFLKDIK